MNGKVDNVGALELVRKHYIAIICWWVFLILPLGCLSVGKLDAALSIRHRMSANNNIQNEELNDHQNQSIPDERISHALLNKHAHTIIFQPSNDTSLNNFDRSTSRASNPFTDPSSIIYHDAYVFSTSIESFLRNVLEERAANAHVMKSHQCLEVYSYYSLKMMVGERITNLLCVREKDEEEDKTSYLTIMRVNYYFQDDLCASIMTSEQLLGHILEFSNKYSSTTFNILHAGEAFTDRELFEARIHDVNFLHTRIIPFTLLFFAVALRSKNPKILLLPLMCIILAFTTSSMLLWIATFCFELPVLSYSPIIAIAITVALTVDYNLFFLSRYKQEFSIAEQEQNETFADALSQTLRHSAHNIVYSSILASGCIVGMMVMPHDEMKA